MNKKIIFFVLGRLLFIEGVFMVFSALVAVLYNEKEYLDFLIVAGLTMFTGSLSAFFTRKVDKQLGKKEGFIIVSLVWVIFSIFGALPFYISGAIPNYTDAFFETMSGFTTTGSSILDATRIDNLAYSLHFWRSITQWIGGMGIIVMAIAIFPILGIGGMQLFAAEVPGVSKDKLHPKIKETAKRLWGIYILFTVVEIVLLWIGGMTFFDAVCHSFTTMATGGYSTHGDSVAFFQSSYIHYIIIIFMFIAGTNFTLSYFALNNKFKKVIKNEEFRWYLFFTLFSAFLIALFLIFVHNNEVFTAIRDSLFQVVSIMTTTGYATVDYMQWKGFMAVILFILMFIGGSAGSTGGGVKVVRIVLLLKNSYYELRRAIHPNAIIPVRFQQKTVPSNIVNKVTAFIVLYILSFVFGTIIISAFDYNIDTAMGAVAATLGNIGPGIGKVGPAENFSFFPDAAKWILSFLMLIGRLELFTVLVLFSKSFWKV